MSGKNKRASSSESGAPDPKRVCASSQVIKQLEAEIASSGSDDARLLTLLEADVSTLAMTHELLVETGIGRPVGRLRKHSNAAIAEKAASIVQGWKALVPASPSAATTKAAATTKSTPDAKPPPNSSVFRARLVSNNAEIYKDPPVLPPAGGKITEPVGTMPPPTFNKTTGRYHFADAKEFTPNLSPEQVLRMGSFGGTYFRSINSSVTGTRLLAADVVKATLPSEWTKGMKASQLTSQGYQNSVNNFRVKCGGSLGMWESSGWISSIDPYGWFQWYCFFWRGRRTTDDARQMKRGLSVMGPTGRFRIQLMNKVIKANTTFDDAKVSPVIRQSLQHWGYELTEADLIAYKKKKGIK